MKQVFIVLLTLLLSQYIGHTQETGSIVGKLTDNEANNVPLAKTVFLFYTLILR
jgi:hypothetical protein